MGKEYSNIFFLMQEKSFLFNRCEMLTLCRYVALVEKIFLVTMSHQRDAGYDFAPLGFPGGEFLHANKRGDKTNRLHSSTSSVNSDCLNFHTYFINTFAKKLPFLSEREVLCYM